MNIRTRLKTPFNPVKHIVPKPSVKPFAGRDEGDMGKLMLAMSKGEGHRRGLPKSVGGRPPSERKSYEPKKGSISFKVLSVLERIGQGTVHEVCNHLPECTVGQVSAGLSYLGRNGRLVKLEQRQTQNGVYCVWGLA